MSENFENLENQQPVAEVFEAEVVGQKQKKPVLPTVALILGIASAALFVLSLICSFILPIVLLPVNLVLGIIPVLGPMIQSLLNPSKLALLCNVIGLLGGIAAIVIGIIAAMKMKAIGYKTNFPTIGMILGIAGAVLNAASAVIISIISFLSAVLSILGLVFPQLVNLLANL